MHIFMTFCIYKKIRAQIYLFMLSQSPNLSFEKKPKQAGNSATKWDESVHTLRTLHSNIRIKIKLFQIFI